MIDFLRKLLRKRPNDAIVEGEYLWCITGNIVDYHYHGEEKELKRGTKHFRPGAKVYCIPEFPGCAHDSMRVIGKPRKQRTMINIIIRTKLITNFRLQKVYSPTLFDEISDHHMYRTFGSRKLQYEELENILHSLKMQFEND